MTFQSFCHHSMGCPTRTSRANRSKLWVFLAEMTGGNPSATLKQTGPLLNHLLPKTLVSSMFVPPLSIRFLLLTYSMIHSLMINHMSTWLCIFFNDIQQSVRMKYGSTNNELVQCSALPLLRSNYSWLKSTFTWQNNFLNLNEDTVHNIWRITVLIRKFPNFLLTCGNPVVNFAFRWKNFLRWNRA